ncbi:MAG: hypothetical protein WA622_03040 [Mycobacterium sp.]|uniref:hypothetical protein n=1 Tax=Mycobacterium sp. TaxID=1785 RepID=UPI003BB7FFA3
MTNTPKGKQVYVSCDLLNGGANYPPGQRCVVPLDQYPRDVRDWCGQTLEYTEAQTNAAATNAASKPGEKHGRERGV